MHTSRQIGIEIAKCRTQIIAALKEHACIKGINYITLNENIHTTIIEGHDECSSNVEIKQASIFNEELLGIVGDEYGHSVSFEEAPIAELLELLKLVEQGEYKETDGDDIISLYC